MAALLDSLRSAFDGPIVRELDLIRERCLVCVRSRAEVYASDSSSRTHRTSPAKSAPSCSCIRSWSRRACVAGSALSMLIAADHRFRDRLRRAIGAADDARLRRGPRRRAAGACDAYALLAHWVGRRAAVASFQSPSGHLAPADRPRYSDILVRSHDGQESAMTLVRAHAAPRARTAQSGAARSMSVCCVERRLSLRLRACRGAKR